EIPDLPTQLWGYNGGLDFRFERPKWRFESNAIVYTNDFPGIYKGWRSANADLSYFLGKQFSTSLFYTTNYTRQSFFIDSFYLDDQFLYNLTTYGLRINYHSSKFKLSLSGGNSHASGIQQTDVIPTYRMGIVNMTWTPIKKLRINLNSMVNFNEGYGIDNELVLHYSNFFSVSTPFGGINMAYKQMPQLTGDLSGTFVNSYRTSMGISPYLSTSLFRNKLSARIQYSYYKIKDVNTERDNQYLVGSMMYTNKRLGVSFQGNVNYGLPSANLYPIRFISASLRKTLNVPIITKRKYYDLNLYCFEDLDGNGVKDAGDSIVSKVNIDMNFNRLVSNKFGHARYKNMDTGTYVLDFRNMKNEKGLIPSRGYIQKLPFYGPVDLYIPFTQGKIVRGKVSITLDSLSDNKFEIDQLKVTATDTEGNKYYTFT